MAKQTVPLDQWELLVIDNGSTDRTPALLGDYSDRLPNLRVIQEPKRGLSNARNTGWRTARGAYVGYLDDDAIPPPNWVEVALDVIADPAPEAFGGPYSNYYTSPKPEWFKDHYQTMDCGNAARALDPGVVSLLAGLNLVTG